MLDNPKNFLQHVVELKIRLLKVLFFFVIFFALSYYFYNYVENFLLKPFEYALKNSKIIFTNPIEDFITTINASIFVSFLITIPLLIREIWLFIVPALTKTEYRIFKLCGIFIPILFFLGVALAYFIIIPNALYFLTQNTQNKIFLPKISELFIFLKRLLIVFGLAFEFPVILFALNKMQLITYNTLKDNWRIVILIITIISAIITPPDAISMILLAIPLILLYLISMFVIKFSKHK